MNIIAKTICMLFIASSSMSMETEDTRTEFTDTTDMEIRGQVSISILPPEVLLSVFPEVSVKELSELMTVCKTWSQIIPQVQHLIISSFFKERWTNPEDYDTVQTARKTYKDFWEIAPYLIEDKASIIQGIEEIYSTHSVYSFCPQVDSISDSFLNILELSTLGSRQATVFLYNFLIYAKERKILDMLYAPAFFGYPGIVDAEGFPLFNASFDTAIKEMYEKFTKQMAYLIKNYAHIKGSSIFVALKCFGEDNLKSGKVTLGNVVECTEIDKLKQVR